MECHTKKTNKFLKDIFISPICDIKISETARQMMNRSEPSNLPKSSDLKALKSFLCFPNLETGRRNAASSQTNLVEETGPNPGFFRIYVNKFYMNLHEYLN